MKCVITMVKVVSRFEKAEEKHGPWSASHHRSHGPNARIHIHHASPIVLAM